MKYLKLIGLISTTVLLINCSTPYQPKGALGGYSEERMIENMYRVEYKGNQHSKPEKIQNYLMYRCAELTKENGFDYFAIVNEERYFDEQAVRPDRDQSFSTRTTMSGGTITTVSPDLQTASKSTNYTGVYYIKFLENIDENLKKAVFNVNDVMVELKEFVKK